MHDFLNRMYLLSDRINSIRTKIESKKQLSNKDEDFLYTMYKIYVVYFENED